ncbi:hypothetical protein ACFL5Z_19955 [Planctomycetota bacterium]
MDESLMEPYEASEMTCDAILSYSHNPVSIHDRIHHDAAPEP